MYIYSLTVYDIFHFYNFYFKFSDHPTLIIPISACYFLELRIALTKYLGVQVFN